MLLGIIGDVHYGASLLHGKKDVVTNLNSRLLDYQNTLRFAFSELKKQGATRLVFTGDIFESRTPTIKQQQLFASDLYYATNQLGFKSAHIILGNHDLQRSNQTNTLAYLQELNLPDIKIVDEICTLKIDQRKISFFPYRDRNYFKTSKAEDALSEIKKELERESAKLPDVIIGHMMVEGTIPAQDYYAELFGTNELSVPQSFFKGFPKVIMGHVHTPGYLTPDIMYTGSLEKRSHEETEDKKVFIFDTNAKTIKSIALPCKPIVKIELSSTDDDINQSLLNAISNVLKDSIVQVTVNSTDDGIAKLSHESLERGLIKKHGISSLMPIKSIPIRAKQERTVKIAEQEKPSEALVKYLSANFQEPELSQLISLGKEIMGA